MWSAAISIVKALHLLLRQQNLNGLTDGQLPTGRSRLDQGLETGVF